MANERSTPHYPTIMDPLSNESDWDLVARILEQFKKDTLYLNSNRREWMGKYPDHWAIVFEEELVSVCPTLEEAVATAENNGIPCNLAAVEHLSSKPFDLILCQR